MPRHTRLQRFIRDVLDHTPFLYLLLLLVVLWLLFSAGLYLVEARQPAPVIDSYGDAMYWGVAAFSTAGIAAMPLSGAGKLIGGIWIVLGSVLFFGAIVATVTAYFMRSFNRPARRIIDTIEYNLEQMDDLSIEELDLLKQTTDGLIEHMEKIKAARTGGHEPS